MTSKKAIAIDLAVAVVSALTLLLLWDALELAWLGGPALP